MDQPDFRALCAELLAATQLYTGLNPAASEMSSVEKTEKLMDAMAATRTALEATSPPEPPTEKELMELEEELIELEEKLWDKYKVIGYQGEEFMYDDGFEYALCDYRSILQIRWGK